MYRYTDDFKLHTLSLITQKFNMEYLAFLMFVGDLTGMVSELCSHRFFSLTCLHAVPEAGYVPFKIYMSMNETSLFDRPFNRSMAMSGAELVNDAPVAKVYFPLFLQFAKQYPQIVALVFQ